MKILVIGGTNFIGPSVVHRLHAIGHEVTIFHRGKTLAELPLGVKEIKGDRAQLPEMKSELQCLSPDVVLDMILYTEQDALTTMKTFKGIAQRVVAISSIDVYRAYNVLLGKESGIVPVPLTEDSPLRQQLYPFENMPQRALNAPADYDKILVEQVVMSDVELPGTVIRLPMVYGPKDPLHRLFPYLKRMDENRLAILLPENFAQWRGCYGYVENVAQAIALALISPQATGRIYHVADLQFSEAERLSHVGKAAGWQGKIISVPKHYLPADWNLPFNTEQDWFADTTRIRQELGYSEVISQEEALRQTIDWERSNPPQEMPQWTGLELLDYPTEDEILTRLP
ncbi:NAD-dependent epimerase/dehydratase family protein [Gloeocapsopsis dulcis]|uniref:NAD-dependent dehydratase n=1 Tax=Gloeocapsopsis dulcis AAB1 = 1H9 TaxID=1433147 RepID=A0A6N8FWA8_9CHRO|nr:NAD-dependent epimerase/dehydratase family protein [Gloeocapsopsis dulcis]MUL37231.1 NAD-dependent dehydratase [Gloeocapsopsis dulcis AAB1 = 1H9]WNN90157.1 NAD-dependent epimerase/dehydratase family protein [Gloeocapsopsis dulcis]